MKTENYIRELYFIVFRQKALIIWTAGIIFVIALAISLFWPATYAAEGHILVRGKKVEKSPEAIEKEFTRPLRVSKEDLVSEESIITSSDVAEYTIKYLVATKQLNISGEKELFTAINKTYNNVKTQIIPASNVIRITYTDRDPKYAVVLLRSLMLKYIEHRLQIFNPVEAEGFFSTQADKYRKKLDDQEEEFLALVNKTNISSPEKEIENNLLLKRDIQIKLNLLKNQAIEKDLQVKHLQKALASEAINLFSFIDNLPINELSNKLQALLVEKGKALRAYHPKSDKIRLIEQHINNIHEILRSEVSEYTQNCRAELQIIQGKIMNIEKKISDINKRNVQLNAQLIKSQRISRDSNVYQSSFDVFASRREEALSVRADNVPAQVSIVKKAFPKGKPVFPRKEVLIPFGFFVGIITGCCLGFIREFFDHTFKKPADVEKYANMPVIFSIHEDDKTNG